MILRAARLRTSRANRCRPVRSAAPKCTSATRSEKRKRTRKRKRRRTGRKATASSGAAQKSCCVLKTMSIFSKLFSKDPGADDQTSDPSAAPAAQENEGDRKSVV